MEEKYDVAEVFFDRVTCSENDNVIAWCLYAMFYELTGQDLNADITFNKAVKLNQAIESHSDHSSGALDDEVKKDEEADEAGKTNEPKSRGSKRGNSQFSKSKPDATNATATVKPPKSPGAGSAVTANVAVAPTVASNVQSVLGHRSPINPPGGKIDDQGTTVGANAAVTTNVDVPTRKTIFMKTAQFLIEYNAFAWAEKCLAKELVNPKGGPSCEFYLLLTRVKLSKGELEEAEKNCCLALSFDYQVRKYFSFKNGYFVYYFIIFATLER